MRPVPFSYYPPGMADRPGVEQVLTRLNDLADRLVSNKRFDDLTELVQKLVDANKKLLSDNETLRGELVKSTKATTERATELEDFIRKEIKKLREEMVEAVENAGGGEIDDTEPPAWIKAMLPGMQERLGWLFDKEVADAVKGKMKGWIQNKGKKVLGGGDDE